MIDRPIEPTAPAAAPTREAALVERLERAISTATQSIAPSGETHPQMQARRGRNEDELAEARTALLRALASLSTEAAPAEPAEAPETLTDLQVGQRVLVPGVVKDIYLGGRTGNPSVLVSVTFTKFSTIVFDRSEVRAFQEGSAK